MRVDARRELVAARRRMRAGREAVVRRPVLHERRDGVAHGDEARAEHDRGLVGDHRVGELHGGLRARLVVAINELDRLAVDAAVLVHDGLEGFERRLLALAEEGAAAGHRHDDVDLVGLGRAGHAAEASECEGAERRGENAISLHARFLPSSAAPPFTWA